MALLIIECLPLIWNVSFPQVFWVKQVVLFVMWMGLFYLTLKILAPELWFSDRVGFFFLVIVAIVPAFLFINYEIDKMLHFHELMERHFHVPASEKKHDGDVAGQFWIIILTLMMIGSAMVIAVGEKLRVDALSRDEWEKERIAFELLFLKAQINPHFFFNVLNSIYALTAKNTEAKEAVYNLSRLMRYVLYDTKTTKRAAEGSRLRGRLHQADGTPPRPRSAGDFR